MTMKKMEDFFNLPPSIEPEEKVIITKTKEELIVEAKEIYSSLSTAEKIDYALPIVYGLDNHDNEMDDIADKAMKTFTELMAMGGNVHDMHAGKIYEVASQMLKTALEAKNAKADKKLKMIDLQIKKVRSEQIDIGLGNGAVRGNSGVEFDRNELLKHLISNKSENSDK